MGRLQVFAHTADLCLVGHRALLETTKTAMRNRQGRLTGIVGIARDITEQRKSRDHLEEIIIERTAALRDAYVAAEAVQRASLQRLEAENSAKLQSRNLKAVGTMAAGIAHDFNNILASIVAYAELAQDELADGSEVHNSVANVISGCSRARDLVARMLDFARRRPGDPVPVNIVFQVREALALLRASLRPNALPVRRLRSGAVREIRERPCDAHPQCFWNFAEGELLGYVGVAQDITQQKQYEESLRRATHNAERANNAKSLFLANMSHEIHTPMNAVIGLTYLLGQTSLNLEQSGFVAQINVSNSALLAVITDVLDISKIEAGELMISCEPFGPGDLLKGLYANMRIPSLRSAAST